MDHVWYYALCVNTGLVFGCLLWLAFHPFTPARFFIFGTIAIGWAMLGLVLCDRYRPERRDDW